MSDKEMITITKEEYEDLKKDSKWLSYLEEAGLDNWEGVDFAREIMEDDNET